ncbi:hypothetical protein T484DRAFT_1945388 [Baffinella frigidus]|nr:hypothetical protein T484DRAFT_1945388 [Cryptophyta sp. CCMP2293]
MGGSARGWRTFAEKLRCVALGPRPPTGSTTARPPQRRLCADVCGAAHAPRCWTCVNA